MRVVRRSSKAVDKATTKGTVRWRRASPDPGRGPRVEVLGRHAGGQSDLFGVGEGLPGERLAAEEAPPAFRQIQPAGSCREGDRVHAWMLPQPLLDGPTGVAGAVVA